MGRNWSLELLIGFMFDRSFAYGETQKGAISKEGYNATVIIRFAEVFFKLTELRGLSAINSLV